MCKLYYHAVGENTARSRSADDFSLTCLVIKGTLFLTQSDNSMTQYNDFLKKCKCIDMNFSKFIIKQENGLYIPKI